MNIPNLPYFQVSTTSKDKKDKAKTTAVIGGRDTAIVIVVVKLAIGHCSLFNLLVRFITGYC